MRAADERQAMEEDLNCILIESHTFSFRQISALKSKKESGLSAGVLPVSQPHPVSKVNILWHSIRRRVNP